MNLQDETDLTLAKVTGIWSQVITAETRSTQTIQRQTTVGKSIRATTKVVVRPRVFDSQAIPAKNPQRKLAPLPVAQPDYELQEVLGEGGMGIVYLARQTSIDRTIAVKMLKPEQANDDDVRTRFLAEAAVTGELDHPNIVPIHDLGCTEKGALFYSMKRVKGTPWCDVLKDKTLNENLDVLMRLADAIAFAHSRGIIHRDIKPENVMLGSYGEVLVMDWGLAISLTDNDKTGHDPSESMAGTPAYMAPEMASGTADQLSFGSDIYLLGATLFEIVTGEPPHSGKNVMGCLYNAAANIIQKYDKKGELYDIAMKAMETNPQHRHQSVTEFQQAIKQYQYHSESILLASKAQDQLRVAERTNDYNDFAQALFGFREAVDLWVRNHAAREGASRAALAYGHCAYERADYDLAQSLLDVDDPDHLPLIQQVKTAVRDRAGRQIRLKWFTRIAYTAVATLLVVFVSAYLTVEAARNRAVSASDLAQLAKEEADRQRDNAKAAEQRAKADFDKAVAAKQAALDAQDREKIQRTNAEQASIRAEQASARAVVEQNKALYEAYIARLGLAASKIEENSYRHALELLNTSSENLRNWEWGRLMYLCRQVGRTLANHKQRVDAVAFSPDGMRAVTASWDNTAKIWDVATGRLLVTINVGQYVHSAAFSPDPNGDLLATGDASGQVQIWDSTDGSFRFALAARPEAVKGAEDPETRAAPAPKEPLAAPKERLNAHTGAVNRVEFSHDGRRLVSASNDFTARLWDLQERDLVRSFTGHNWWVWSARFSQDDKLIVTAGQDKLVIVWRADNGEKLYTFDRHSGPVFAAAFVPPAAVKDMATTMGGKLEDNGTPLIVSGGDERVIAMWDALTGKSIRVFTGHSGAVRSLEFSVDGKKLLSAGNDNTAKIWELASGTLLKTLRGHSGWISSAVFGPQKNELVLTGSHDTEAKLWDVRSYQEVRMLQGHTPGQAVLSARFSDDGSQIITASVDKTAKIWETRTGQEVRTLDEGHNRRIFSVDIDSTGTRAVTASQDRSARIWSLESGNELVRLEGHTRTVRDAVFSHHGQWVLTGSEDGSIRIWDAATGKTILEIDELGTGVFSVAFSPDDSQILIGLQNGRARLYNTHTGKLLQELRGHTAAIFKVAFMPDGRRAVTGSDDRTSGLWDLTTGKEIADTLKHTHGVTGLALSRDGKYILTSNFSQGWAKLWNAETRKLMREFDKHESLVYSVEFTPDSRSALVGTENGTLYVWDLLREAPPLKLPAQTKKILSLACSPDSKRVLVGGEKEGRLWDLTTKTQVMTLNRLSEISGAAFCPGSKLVVTTNFRQPAKLWEWETGHVLMRYQEKVAESTHALAMSDDGAMLLTIGEDSNAGPGEAPNWQQAVKVWDRVSGKRIVSLGGPDFHTQLIRSGTFSHNGKWMVTTANDGLAKMWEVQTGKLIRTFTGHEWWVLGANFSPDDTLLVTAGADNNAFVWDVATGKKLRELKGHTAFVTTCTFSPDGERILTGSDDSTAKLWDAMTGQEIFNLEAHLSEITWATFSPDGRNALTASRDGTAIVWPAIDWETVEKKEQRTVAQRQHAALARPESAQIP